MPSIHTHKLITHDVLEALNFVKKYPKEFIEGVLEGVGEPDTLPDREVRVYVGGYKKTKVRTKMVYVRHHGVSPNLVRYYLSLASYFYRKRNLYDAGRALGRALHYIQDSAILRRRYLILDVHDEVEAMVEKLYRVKRRNLISLIESGVAVTEYRPSSNPEQALNAMIRGTVGLLCRFEELLRLDLAEVKKRYRKTKLQRALVYLSLCTATITTLIVAPYLLFIPMIILLITTYVINLYVPKAYWDAFAVGLTVVRPRGLTPALRPSTGSRARN